MFKMIWNHTLYKITDYFNFNISYRQTKFTLHNNVLNQLIFNNAYYISKQMQQLLTAVAFEELFNLHDSFIIQETTSNKQNFR